MSAPRSGIVLVDKPAGLTSHDVVRLVRRALGTRRVGHAGTLDPLATGLLPVLVGPATRLARFLHGWPKSYVGVVRLGAESSTGDAEGAPDAIPDVPLPPPEILAHAVRRLTGRQLQEPPAFSAKKIGGVRAHRLARRGGAPALEPVPVTVYALRVVPADGGRLAFAARVSSGTYLRALARDLGRLCGTGAFLAALRRTGIGPLRVRAAVRVTAGGAPDGDDALAAALEPPERIPLPLPTARLDEEALSRFVAGQAAQPPGGEPPEPGAAVRVLGPGGILAGIAVAAPGGALRPRVVLASGAGVAARDRA